MKPVIRTPFFEMGVKNYIYGDKVLALALHADAMAKKYDIDVLFIAPYTEIRRIAEQTDRLIVLAPYMDLLRPGRGMADVLPEALKAAGAQGVVINHCERPVTLSAIDQTIRRANELELLTFCCASTVEEAQAIAHFKPDILNPEPAELIGTGQASDMRFVQQAIKAVGAVSPTTLVEQAAGITCGQQVYDFIMAGSAGAGAASGIVNAADPFAVLEEMIAYTRKAADALAEKNKEG